MQGKSASNERVEVRAKNERVEWELEGKLLPFFAFYFFFMVFFSLCVFFFLLFEKKEMSGESA